MGDEYACAIMWICVCGNANARIRWNEYTYSIMWIHVFDNVDMRVRWNGNTYLMTWIYVFDYVRIRARWIGPLRLAECSQPISWVSVGISRNVCWYFAECFVCISLAFVGFSRCVRCIMAIRQQHFRKPFAAVGADLSRPHIRIHPQNDKRKCACGGVKTRIWWREYTYSIMWIYVFDYVRIRARWIGPLRLTECSHPISWVCVGISRNVCWYLAECFVCISLVFATLSQSVSSILANRSQP